MRGRSSAVNWNQRQRESRLFEEVAVMACRKGFSSQGSQRASGRIFPATPLVTTKSF